MGEEEIARHRPLRAKARYVRDAWGFANLPTSNPSRLATPRGRTNHGGPVATTCPTVESEQSWNSHSL